MASTSSQEEDSMTPLEQKQLEDINMKIKLAKIVSEACELEKHLQGPRFPVIEEENRFAGYVGSQYKELFNYPEIRKSAMRRRTLEVMLQNENQDKHHYTQIREVVYDLYVNQRLLPTKSLLYQQLMKIGITDIVDLNQALKLGGFVWTPLPNHKKCILIEKPELVAARFQYLKLMLKYRSENRPIVYLEEGNHSVTDVAYKLHPDNVFVIVASKNGVIDTDFVPLLNVDHNDNLEKFIEKIGHLLPSRCVLVLNERPHHVRKTVPTEFSNRKEMMDWLKDCKIPFEDTMHSAELFALIQRFKNKFPSVKFQLEGVAKKFDVEVVYKPYLMLLNFFKSIDVITSTTNTRSKKSIVCLKYAKIDWQKLEDELIATERKMFEEDMKMEVIIDKLMTMAYDGKISPQDVEQQPDSNECSDANMSDTVVL